VRFLCQPYPLLNVALFSYKRNPQSINKLNIIARWYYFVMSRRLATRYHRKFMQSGFDMILNYIEETLSSRKPVINFSLPHELKKKVDFSIGEEPTSPEYLLQQCKLIMENQVRPHHPHFHNQLFGGFD